jgi:hypothetical protein
MSLKKGTAVFAIIKGKVAKGKVTRTRGGTINVKVGTASHRLEDTQVFTSEVPALKALAKVYRGIKSGNRKQATAVRRQLRYHEKGIKTADRVLARITKRLAKASK